MSRLGTQKSKLELTHESGLRAKEKVKRQGKRRNLKEGMELRKRSIQEISVGVAFLGLSEGKR